MLHQPQTQQANNMATNQRYQFSGTNPTAPDVTPGNTGNIANLFESEQKFESNVLLDRWNLEDEKIQLDLLKGIKPQQGFDRYMNLAQVAGAAGNELASVTYQQKAYALLQAAQGGLGGGRGGSRGGRSKSKAEVAAARDSYSSDIAALNDAAQAIIADFGQNWKDVELGRIPPELVTQDTLNSIYQIQQAAAGLRAKYADYIGGDSGKADSGWADAKKQIDALQSLGTTTKPDDIGAQLQAGVGRAIGVDQTATEKKNVFSILEDYDSKLTDRTAQPDPNTGVRPRLSNPDGTPKNVLYYEPEKKDSTTGLPTSGGRLRVGNPVELQSNYYMPVTRTRKDGFQEQIYYRPTDDSLKSYIDNQKKATILQAQIAAADKKLAANKNDVDALDQKSKAEQALQETSLARLQLDIPQYDESGLVGVRSFEVDPRNSNNGWVEVVPDGSRQQVNGAPVLSYVPTAADLNDSKYTALIDAAKSAGLGVNGSSSLTGKTELPAPRNILLDSLLQRQSGPQAAAPENQSSSFLRSLLGIPVANAAESDQFQQQQGDIQPETLPGFPGQRIVNALAPRLSRDIIQSRQSSSQPLAVQAQQNMQANSQIPKQIYNSISNLANQRTIDPSLSVVAPALQSSVAFPAQFGQNLAAGQNPAEAIANAFRGVKSQFFPQGLNKQALGNDLGAIINPNFSAAVRAKLAENSKKQQEQAAKIAPQLPVTKKNSQFNTQHDVKINNKTYTFQPLLGSQSGPVQPVAQQTNRLNNPLQLSNPLQFIGNAAQAALGGLKSFKRFFI